ncbi:MAG: hypothetical protein ABIR55_16805 [Burkholderiaceae bacterium]
MSIVGGVTLSAALPVLAQAPRVPLYGENVREAWRTTPRQIDRILRGEKPADIPIEQPNTFDFIINSKQLGP